MRRSVGDISPWEDTFPLRGADVRYRWYLSRAVPMRRDDGSVTGWFGTHTDITERLEAEQALAASDARSRRALMLEQSAHAEAERAIKARDEVLAIVAHDLRNPMNTIVTTAGVLALTSQDDQRLRHVGIIQRSITEMERLIADLLDVTRLESGSLALRTERVDVHALVDEALEQFEQQALARQVALRRRLEPDVHPVAGDRDRLIQVLANLIGNALKFTPAGHDVSVGGDGRWSGADLRKGLGQRDPPGRSAPHLRSLLAGPPRLTRGGRAGPRNLQRDR